MQFVRRAHDLLIIMAVRSSVSVVVMAGATISILVNLCCAAEIECSLATVLQKFTKLNLLVVKALHLTFPRRQVVGVGRLRADSRWTYGSPIELQGLQMRR